jgi:nicotinate-nucleotide--dimethylbenzimidazole phosphoribosyltransferase
VLDVLAERYGVGRRVVDVVTRVEPARGEPLPELPDEEYQAAFELGRYVADEEADGGTDLLVVGLARRRRDQDLVAATALIAALLDQEPIPLIGTDTARGSVLGLDDRAWARRVTGVRDVLRRTRSEPPPTPVELVRRLAGSRIAMLTGLLQQAAERRTAVMLDGTAACAAALAADRLGAGAASWQLVAEVPAEPAGQVAATELDLVPLLDLGIRAGTGAAGLLAVGLLAAAVDAVGALVEAGSDRGAVLRKT